MIETFKINFNKVVIMWCRNKLLLYGLRILLLAVFLGSTFTFSVHFSTTSILSLFLLLGSWLLLSPKTDRQKGIHYIAEEKLKTKDILTEFYPPLTNTELENKVHKEIMKFVLYDVENTQSLERFAAIKNQSDCLFAKKAKLWGSPPWVDGLSLEENIYRLLPMFIKFTVVLTTHRLDGFVIELPGDKFGTSIEKFGDGFQRVLQIISDNDPAGFHCMNKSYIDKRGWVFEFNKVTFFVTTFAPFYPENHPRYAHGVNDSYILFQPELSFAFHDLPPDTPTTNWENPKTVRDRIRVAFKEAGRKYTIPSTIYHPMVEEMIRPIKETDSLYAWWKNTRCNT